MKVLVLGGSGMLGHKLLQIFGKRFETTTILRSPRTYFEKYRLLPAGQIFENTDLTDFIKLEKKIKTIAPQIIVNAAGVVKQNENVFDVGSTWKLNAELPQKLAEISENINSRLICISTDCVFDGKTGNYTESDSPNSSDLYGTSKIAGEIKRNNCLTFRTSMIGRELQTSHGLVEWFFSQQNKSVKGYKKAFFSGFPTIVLAEILADVIEHYRELEGIYHLAADRISKYELLHLIKKHFDLNVEIEPDNELQIDRSLNGGKFAAATNFEPSSWEKMIKLMAEDAFPYAELRNENFRK